MWCYLLQVMKVANPSDKCSMFCGSLMSTYKYARYHHSEGLCINVSDVSDVTQIQLFPQP